jgi:hypothetical protein
MFLIKLCAVELVATLLGALTTLHTDLKTLRLEDAYTVEGIRIGDYAFYKSPTATHRDSAIEYCKLKGQSLMCVQPAFDLPRIFKEMEVNKAWIDVAKTNSQADWKDPLGKKLYLKTSTEGFSVQQATEMLENANEVSTTEESITKGVILSKETASKFVYKEIDKEGDVTAMPTRQPIINETVIQPCQACTHRNRTVPRNQIRYSNNAPSGRIVHRRTKMSSVPLYLADSDISD